MKRCVALVGTIGVCAGVLLPLAKAQAFVPAPPPSPPAPARQVAAFPGVYPAGSRGGLEVGQLNPFTLLVAPGPGSTPLVMTESEIGVPQASFLAYSPRFRGGVRATGCDLRGDGEQELVTAPGPGGGPHIRVFDQSTTFTPWNGGFFAYDSRFAGGVFVACADVDGDGKAEIITAPGPGGGPNVRVFAGDGTLKASFLAEDSRFTGGIRVAADPALGIVTGAGPGGGPAVRTFSPLGAPRASAFCFDPAYTGGVTVAAGDVWGDGAPEVVCGSATGTSNVAVRTADLSPVTAFFAMFNGSTGTGVRVAVLHDMGAADVIAAPGPGTPASATTYAVRPPAADSGEAIAYVNTSGPSTGVRLVSPDGTGDGAVAPAFNDIAFSGDGRRMIRRTIDGSVVVGQRDGTNLTGMPAAVATTDPSAWARSAPVIVGGQFSDGDGRFVAFAPDGSQLRSSGSQPNLAPNHARVSADGRIAAAILVCGPGASCGLGVWHTDEPGALPNRISPASAYIFDLSPDGARIAFCTPEGVHVIDTTGANDFVASAGGCGSGVAWSHDGSHILAADGSEVRVFSFDGRGQPVVLGFSGKAVGTAAWSPDDSEVASEVVTAGQTFAHIETAKANGRGSRPTGVTTAGGDLLTWLPGV